LGIHVGAQALLAAGVVAYRVADSRSGLVESEYNHLVVGIMSGTPRPNRREVASLAAIELEELSEHRLRDPDFAAWFPIVTSAAMPVLRSVREELLDGRR
jgi:isopentenyl-diphosphate delta-isomerase